MSKVCLGIPTLNRYDLLVRLLGCAMAQTCPPNLVLIVDNGGKFESWLKEHGVVLFPRLSVQVVNPQRNTGAGGGCNLGMNLAFNSGFDYYIHANDDLEFGESTLEMLVKAADSNPDIPMVEVKGLFYTMFLAKPQMLKEVGGFDEQFWPAYFEDNDHVYRRKLAGMQSVEVEVEGWRHFGSATITAFSHEERLAHDKQFEANRDRYVRKWGGTPGHETFTQPYLGGGKTE